MRVVRLHAPGGRVHRRHRARHRPGHPGQRVGRVVAGGHQHRLEQQVHRVAPVLRPGRPGCRPRRRPRSSRPPAVACPAAAAGSARSATSACWPAGSARARCGRPSTSPVSRSAITQPCALMSFGSGVVLAGRASPGAQPGSADHLAALTLPGQRRLGRRCRHRGPRRRGSPRPEPCCRPRAGSRARRRRRQPIRTDLTSTRLRRQEQVKAAPGVQRCGDESSPHLRRPRPAVYRVARHRAADPEPRREILLRRVRGMGLVATALVGAMTLAACGSSDSGSSSGDSGSGGSAAPSNLKVGLAYDIGGRGDQSFNDAAAAGLDKAKSRPRRRRRQGAVGRAPARPTPPKATRLRAARRRRATTRSSRSASPTPPRSTDGRRRSTRTSSSRSSTTPRVEAPNVDRPGLRRGAGLLPGRRGGGAEDQDRQRSASSVASTSPLIQKFEAGYVAGVKAVNPDIKVAGQVPHPAAGLHRLQRPGQGQDRRRGHVRRRRRRRLPRGRRLRRRACSQAAKADEQAGHRRRLRPVPDRRPGGQKTSS